MFGKALVAGLIALLGATGLNAQTFPSNVNASSGNVANATTTATIPAVAGKLNYLSGVIMTAGGATAAAVVTCTITGTAGGTITFIYGAPAGVGVMAPPFNKEFAHPVSASGLNVAIVASCPALGTGNTRAAISLFGYMQ